jgi:hypothetical protein
MNDKFVRSRAVDFAQRVKKDAGEQPEAQCRLAWRIALGREPSPSELASGTAFLATQLQRRSAPSANPPKVSAQSLALADLCQAIFAMNEFIYVD